MTNGFFLVIFILALSLFPSPFLFFLVSCLQWRTVIFSEGLEWDYGLWVLQRNKEQEKKVWIGRNQRATEKEQNRRGAESEVHLEIWLRITEDAWWLCRFMVCLHAFCCWYIHCSVGYSLDLARLCFVLIMCAFLKWMEISDTCLMCDEEISVVGFG